MFTEEIKLYQRKNEIQFENIFRQHLHKKQVKNKNKGTGKNKNRIKPIITSKNFSKAF